MIYRKEGQRRCKQKLYNCFLPSWRVQREDRRVQRTDLAVEKTLREIKDETIGEECRAMNRSACCLPS